jgi:hypothetical protein
MYNSISFILSIMFVITCTVLSVACIGSLLNAKDDSEAFGCMMAAVINILSVITNGVNAIDVWKTRVD